MNPLALVVIKIFLKAPVLSAKLHLHFRLCAAMLVWLCSQTGVGSITSISMGGFSSYELKDIVKKEGP